MYEIDIYMTDAHLSYIYLSKHDVTTSSCWNGSVKIIMIGTRLQYFCYEIKIILFKYVPGVELMTVLERAGVVHSEHIALFRFNSTPFWDADYLNLKFGDLWSGEGSSGESQYSKHAAQRHDELTKSYKRIEKCARLLRPLDINWCQREFH